MGDITENEIHIFIEAIANYFHQISREAPEIQGAFLVHAGDLPPLKDLTGVIGITGRYAGCVYFSAPRQMMRHLLVAMNEPDHSDENLLDAVGEVANTIAGNARRHFGEHMQISVPITMSGTPERIKSAVRSRPYAIQLRWKQYEATLIVDIENKPA